MFLGKALNVVSVLCDDLHQVSPSLAAFFDYHKVSVSRTQIISSHNFTVNSENITAYRPVYVPGELHPQSVCSSGAYVVSVFFDLEKAYDTTWNNGILGDLHQTDLRGLLPKFVSNLFNNRTFRVPSGFSSFNSFTKEMDVPQQSLLNVYHLLCDALCSSMTS